MTDPNNEAKSHWRSTQIGTLLAIIVALITIVAFITGKKTLPELLSSIKPSPTASPLDVVQGDWGGDITNSTEDAKVSLKLGDCSLDKVCGTLLIETSGSDPCTGNIRFNAVKDNRLLFILQNRAPACGSARSEYLEILDANTLLYVSLGDDGEYRGTIHRTK